jgi:hypothetical protein
LTDHSQRSTAHLFEHQTFFSLVSGEKADNQNQQIALSKRELNSRFLFEKIELEAVQNSAASQRVLRHKVNLALKK